MSTVCSYEAKMTKRDPIPEKRLNHGGIGVKKNQRSRVMQRVFTTLCAGILPVFLFSSQHRALGSTKADVRASGWRMVTGAPSVLSKYKSHITQVHPDNGTETIQVQFQLQNQPELQKLLVEQRTPGSPNYHHWLTPTELQEKFAPPLSERLKVEAYFESQGFRLLSRSANGLADTFVATHSQIVRAFHTQLGRVQIGRTSYLTNVSPLYIPNSIPTIVTNVVGINKVPLVHPMSVRTTVKSRFQPHDGWAYAGYGPQELQAAYGESSLIASGCNGAGTRIAILTFSPFRTSDVATYRDSYGLPAAQINVIPVDGGSTYTDGEDETTLDVEVAGALAPGAILDVYETEPWNDITVLLNQVISDNRDNVATISWGYPENEAWSWTLRQTEALAEEALAEGITLFAASGDNGAYDDGSHLGVDYPADLPAFEGVGGTALILNSDGSYESETAWDGSGGGVSTFFSLPPYQRGVVNDPADPDVPAHETMRMVPDVSANADPTTGDAIYFTGLENEGLGWGIIGGTSAASPTWAGVLATIESALTPTQRLGDIHGIVYSLGLKKSNALHPVDQGTNGKYDAGPGYDLVTGWGSPNAANFVTALQPNLLLKVSTDKIITGDTAQVQATYKGKDVTSSVAWSSDSTSVATIDSNGKITAIGPGVATISGTYNGETETVTITVVNLISLTVSPTALDLTVGQSQALTLKAVYSDGSIAYIQGMVQWSSGDPSIVTVDGNGVVRAGSTPGSTTIQTTYGGRSVSVPVTVHPALVGITATLQSTKLLVGGDPTTLSVTANYSDGTTADVTNACTVKSTYGDLKITGNSVLAQYYGNCTDTLVVTYRGMTSKITVTIVQTTFITMNPSGSIVIPKKSTQALKLIASYSDKTTADVTTTAQWKSSNMNVATVAADGTLTAVAPGTATITATYLGKTAALNVTVTPLLTKLTATLSSGTVQIGGAPVTVKVTAYYDNGTSAVVTNGVQIKEESTSTQYVRIQGLSIYGVAQGTDILDVSNGGFTVKLPITVVPMLSSLTMDPRGPVTIQKGTSSPLQVTAHYNDGTTADVTSNVTWKSSNPNVVNVTSDGTLHAVAKGTAMISGSYLGRSLSLSVTVTPVLQGITATLSSNIIQIGAAPVTLKVIAQYDDGTSAVITNGVTVTENDTSTKNVSVNGMYVYGLKQGTDTLTVQYQNKSASVDITVVPMPTSLNLNPTGPLVLQKGSTQALTVTAQYKDNSTADVTSNVSWKSSNANVVRVAPDGTLTAVAPGSATVTGTYLGRTVNISVTVTKQIARLTAKVSNNPVIVGGSAATVTVTAYFTDNTSSTVIAKITSEKGNVRVSGNVLYGISNGTDTLDITYAGASTTLSVDVVHPLASLTVSPSGPLTINVADGPQQLLLTARYTDNVTADVTSKASWRSSNPNVVAVAADGTITPISAGTAYVYATYMGRTITIKVTCN
jgi:subtilase family serine protease